MKLLNDARIKAFSGGSVYEVGNSTIVWNRMPTWDKTERDIQKEYELIKYYQQQNKTIVEVW